MHVEKEGVILQMKKLRPSEFCWPVLGLAPLPFSPPLVPGSSGSLEGQWGRGPQGQESTLCCVNSRDCSGSPGSLVSLSSHIPDILPRLGRGRP